MADRTLRSRLRAGLVTAGVVLSIAALLAAVALVLMRDRQDAITGEYFTAITEADGGHIQLLDIQASIQAYAESGDRATLAVLERVTGEGEDEGPDTEALLARLLGDDHRVLVLRRETAAALDTWFGEHVEPMLATIEQEGPGSLTPQQLAAEEAAFAAMETGLEDYSAALRAEREAANTQLRTLMDVTTGSFAVLTIGALVAGTLLWVFLRRWVTDPLTALASDSRRVTGGDVRHPVAQAGVGEVAALASDIEAMRSRLVVLLEASAQARAQLEASHAELEEQAEDLRRSNRDLEQFAYVASHDLQEPLRKVASFTQLLASRYSGQLDERADQYIAFAVDGAKRMQRLINDLLGFSRVGRIGTEVSDVDLDAVLDRVLDDLEQVIDETGAKVVRDDLPTVRGEEPLLAQLLANVIGNALKFRHPDRRPLVRIEATRVGGYWEMACRDNGIGIDPRYADRVFLIFQRLHPKDVYDGTGIGLALCKKIVEYHGGSIWVDGPVEVDVEGESGREGAGEGDGEGAGEGDGEGTVIRWTLPAADADGPDGARRAAVERRADATTGPVDGNDENGSAPRRSEARVEEGSHG